MTEAVTNFDPSTYEEGKGKGFDQNLDLSLGNSIQKDDSCILQDCDKATSLMKSKSRSEAIYNSGNFKLPSATQEASILSYQRSNFPKENFGRNLPLMLLHQGQVNPSNSEQQLEVPDVLKYNQLRLPRAMNNNVNLLLEKTALMGRNHLGSSSSYKVPKPAEGLRDQRTGGLSSTSSLPMEQQSGWPWQLHNNMSAPPMIVTAASS